MEYVIGVIALLIGGLVYERTKRKSSEAILENLDSKKKDGKLEAEVIKDQARLEVESEKREEIKNEPIKDVSVDDLVDFFNKPKK